MDVYAACCRGISDMRTEDVNVNKQQINRTERKKREYEQETFRC